MKTSLIVGHRYPFAYVAFGGTPSFWWMRFLKKGYCHCILILGNGRHWIVIDPLAHFTDLVYLENISVCSFFQERGYRLVRATPCVPAPQKCAVRPYTCVEVAKRFLGLNKPFILTPYQLFCFLYLKKVNNP